jgi:hypothetical protein
MGMSERERLLVLIVGAILSLGVTAIISFLAVTVTDTSERSILFGALIGTGAFGGGALFGLLGHRTGTGSGGPTTNIEAPSTVNVRGGEEPPEVRRDDA